MMATRKSLPYRFLCVLCALFLLSACSKEKNTVVEQEKFETPTASCASIASHTQYIVHWKSGQTSLVHAKGRQDFFDKVLYDFADDILKAEHDYRVSINLPQALDEDDEGEGENPSEDEEDSNANILNWGPTQIQANELWARNQKGDGIIVAVIDSGIDPTHTELANQLAINTAEIAGNGIDDDGNGFIDDVSGWDFVTDSGEIEDLVGHGSHVSGIIAAQHDVGQVLGVAPKAKILPLNFMESDGTGSLGLAIAAMDYAVTMGAKVINASWGGSGCSTVLESKISQLENHGVLFIAAAGNSGVDLDTFPEYPAAFTLPMQITVGASTQNDFTSGFSNTSRTLVDLVAPGSEIVSTVPEHDLRNTKSGTSMAAPFVSGVAALIFSGHPNATAAQVKQAILSTVDQGPYPVLTEGRLNAKRAFESL